MSRILIILSVAITLTYALETESARAYDYNPSAADVLQDVFKTCLSSFSVNCVKPKAMRWLSSVQDKPLIKITEDLVVMKKRSVVDDEDQKGLQKNIIDKFDDFLVSHDVVAQPPALLRPGGLLGNLVPRSFQLEPIQAPLASTGRSKLVKKVIFPFLLGLKFKTAVLVPLALALIALKTWKAFTLGLISIVLTGANAIFSKFTKQPAYEVVHLPHYVDSHHYDVVPQVIPAPPVPVVPAQAAWPHPVYRASRSAQDAAYNAYLN